MRNKIGTYLLRFGLPFIIGLIIILNWIYGDDSGYTLAALMILGAIIVGPIVAIGGLMRKENQGEHKNSKIGLVLWRGLLLLTLAGGIYLVLVFIDIAPLPR